MQLNHVAPGPFENLQGNFEKSPRMEDINFPQPIADEFAYSMQDAVFAFIAAR